MLDVDKQTVDEQAQDISSEAQDRPSVTGANSGSLLADYKGKLAIGAAAMLGLAIFYRWWESRLAREDPNEYERLRRLKSAIEHVDAQPQDNRPS